MPESMQQLQDLEHAQRTGVALRGWNMVVYHYNVFAAKRRIFQRCQIAVCWFTCQFSSPVFGEYRAVNLLMLLCSRRDIGPACRSFVMDNFAERLVQHLVTRLTNFEREVGILVICREVARIEAAQLLK